MVKKIKKIGNVVYWFTITVLVVIATAITFSVLKIPGGMKLLVVQSGSMEPTIKTGSVILVKKQDTYNIGDIISFFEDKGNSITHRITKITVIKGREFFNTKGDANQKEDREIIGVDSVLGKTVLSLPYFGYIITFAKTQQGFIFLVVVPATIIIFSEILNIKKEILLWKGKKNNRSSLADKEKKWQYLTHD